MLTGAPIDALDTADDGDVDLLHQIFWALDTYSIDDVRVTLGKVLHSIQDFYSHSNRVEIGNLELHPGFGRVGPVFDHVPKIQDTCTAYGDPLPDVKDEDCNDCDHNIIVCTYKA